MKYVKLFENFIKSEFEDNEFEDDNENYSDEDDTTYPNYFYSSLNEILENNIELLDVDVKMITEHEEDGLNHILTVKGVPSIGGINTKNGNFTEMLHFFAKYIDNKGDKFSQYVLDETSHRDSITIIDNDKKFIYSCSDLYDFMRD